MLLLRGYQERLKTKVYEAWKKVLSVLLVLATGGGKTVTFASLMLEHKGASAAVVHRKEIVAQISQALARIGVKHRVIAPPAVVTRIRRKHLKEFGKSFIDPGALCGVVSVQTLASKGSAKNGLLMAWVRQVTLAVFDEGHHYVKSGTWARAVELLSGTKENPARRLFVTATPERADGKGLGAQFEGYAEEMIEGPNVKELQDWGYLCQFKYLAPSSDLDLSNIPLTSQGDLNAAELRKRVVASHLVGDVVDHYQRHLAGKRAIVFATDVLTAGEIAAAFKSAGIAAMALSGETESADRDNAIDAFEDGKLKVLVNVDLFDEGFDVPAADGCIIARPTESLAKFLQMVGRVLRVVYAPGYDLETVEGRLAAIAAGPKPYAVVIDPVNNWLRHGPPNWPRKWSLSGREKGSRSSDVPESKSCTTCTQPYPAYKLACPYCSAVNAPAGRKTPQQVDGDLAELDMEAMQALMAKVRKADMSDDNFRMDQIARGVPPIGRGVELRRHKAAQYRRAVLKELVAWWVGCQNGRDMREIHKRFYHRFGIDIVTAFTLNEADTDALINLISDRFHHDLTEVAA
jgi:DNA repair protein RadD